MCIRSGRIQKRPLCATCNPGCTQRADLKCKMLPLSFDPTAGGRCRGSRTRRHTTVARPSAAVSRAERRTVGIPGGWRRSRRRVPAMNCGRYRPRHRDSAVCSSRRRNARVNSCLRTPPVDRFIRELVQMSERFPRHAQTCRVLSENEGRGRCNLRCRNWLGVHRNQRRRMRKRRLSRHVRGPDWTACHSALRRCERGYVIEAVPFSARHPSPANVVAIRPGTVVIRSPRPWIRRYPGVARTLIPGP